ncbi:MAG: YabP/YqfC family sporulation protein [Clostridia bacterium]|nr:YabP/YqfC family sporulation protein [Clostridia bacterium]MDE6605878.1 YabP/YqfC family sporulation protein [Clostridia bacterium]
MSYKKEIQSKLKSNIDGIGNTFTITLDKGYAVIEGHKGIVQFDKEQIIVKLKKGSVIIKGSDLSIASSQSKELVIKGDVTDVSLEGVYRQ